MKKQDSFSIPSPLPEVMRPKNFEDFVGQDHLTSENSALRKSIEQKSMHSMVFWGPPGTGKTTLARIISDKCGLPFHTLSAVTSGIKDVRKVIELSNHIEGKLILFVDEIHRFNKAQQDGFLPFVEDGTLLLIGATTENPSFELNNALLSRLRIYIFKQLGKSDLKNIIDNVLSNTENGLGNIAIEISEHAIDRFVSVADGDGRRALNLLEAALTFLQKKSNRYYFLDQYIDDVISSIYIQSDKNGDLFYGYISALHKSMRGSDPDAVLYWYARMIQGGCDPRYIARRAIRMASEDIGNADPRALHLAIDAASAYERLGSPEGELAVAQALVYLACAPKSNAIYNGYNEALSFVKKTGSLSIPKHILNGSTKLEKSLGYGENYLYPHDEENGYIAGQNYLPDDITNHEFYRPVDRGLEIKIREKLQRLKNLNKKNETE